MSHEPSYSEALHLYEVQTRIRNKHGRKVVRDGKWVKWDGFTTPERQMRALSCTGDPDCSAVRHIHGCFADMGNCDHPSEHA